MTYQNSSILWLLLLACILLLPTAITAQVKSNPSPKISVSMLTLQSQVQTYFCGIGGGNKCKLQDTECQASINYIAGLKEAGNFNLNNLPIQNNKCNVRSVTFQTIETTGLFEFANNKENGDRKVSGLLALPDKDAIKGIVIYFHGTVLSKGEVPSVQSSSTQIYKAIAGIFASKNYAVLFPDYPGLGLDQKNVHPYVLYPQQNVGAAIYLLNAAVQVLNNKYGKSGKISKANPLALMSNGYSEGGAYSVWFGKCNSPTIKNTLAFCKKLKLDESYKIVAITGSEGAYDTSDTIKNFLLQEVSIEKENPFRIVSQAVTNAVKPGLASLAILSYATYNPYPFQLKDTLVNGFYKMDCTPEWLQPQCNIGSIHRNINQALSLTGSSSQKIGRGILMSALKKQNNGFQYTSILNIKSSSENSLRALIIQSVLLTKTFDSTLEEASIVSYGNQAPYPVFIFSFRNDSVVSPVNADKFITHNNTGNVHNYFLDNQKFKVCAKGKYTDADHIGAYLVSHLFVLNFFEQIMDPKKSGSCTATIASEEL